MNIKQLDPARILISLCDKDLERYGVSFETLDIGEHHSRSVIIALLRQASEATGVSLREKRLLIEALRYESGCLLLITVRDIPRRRRYRIRYYHQASAYRFDNAEDFLSCIRALYLLKSPRYPSSAYRGSKGYYLIIHSTDGLKSSYQHTLTEFSSGKLSGKLLPAFLSEHGKVLAQKNAIQIIGKKLH